MLKNALDKPCEPVKVFRPITQSMKNNQILSALTGIFLLCSLVTFYNVWHYRNSLKQLSEIQGRASYVRSVLEPMLQSLLNDTVEYSKKNPAVMPILQLLTNGPARTAAPMPMAKPATK